MKREAGREEGRQEGGECSEGSRKEGTLGKRGYKGVKAKLTVFFRLGFIL